MQTQTLKIYDTVVTIHTYQFNRDVTIEGLPNELPEHIHSGGTYKPVDNRRRSSYVARGYTPEWVHLVMAKGIDQKELSNILHSLGVIDGLAYEVDTDLVTVINNNPEELDTVEDIIDEVAIASAEIAEIKDKKRRRK